ncbi:DNA mismatch repair protein mutL [Bartonella bacilliformis str. Heidi Mejia]|uniref:DNA mismatch repair endonuclease MutL n=1 Tax=Bartonella bacilliformis TaxID=774 RepID=UPI00044D4D9C|nr:DNA mismatch repair endonuclease MutL [Bartonella bacilliformis]EYS90990.1 DNA mismatch repair protein mutL [Bartonella bacilliformis str. Heidi Mejia]KEG15691.1 DNA mismatch repair protein mutL [Bartonella bacilliformis Cond044]KEG17896.1 DNA mismatch repair protein mutL [Bartonella bacilliformis Hosp800-02]KEG21817.1 DNA mismatch repair protein mutL [Bartonella bacilliformis VAB9028]KEG23192.1 DNA mismatch repair protein mutL [Bartonella bacilliformis CAR600-02]
MIIRHLSENIINQIAAGEVIERPANVIKELVENAIDAQATRIEISIVNGGKNFIRVSDNGCGIPADQLTLAVSRHCTSKIVDDVSNICFLGFRGEALPSIGSVAKLKLTSRTQDADNANEISVIAGKIEGPKPAAANPGTIVEVRDLFFVTPARLKFMKTDRAETSAITDMIKRIAIAFPHIRFSLSSTDRMLMEFPATENNTQGQLQRITQIMGKEFAPNSIALNAERESVRLTGFTCLPSFNRSNSLHQFAYVNGRPVRDKLLWGAIRGAYADAIARDRHAVSILFIDLPPADVDVNVHPTKADVRFRDPGLIRGLIIGAIHEALHQAGVRHTSTHSESALAAFQIHSLENLKSTQRPFSYTSQPYHRVSTTTSMLQKPLDDSIDLREGIVPITECLSAPSSDTRATIQTSPTEELHYPLGAAKAQIHKNYIIAQTQDSLIIVDQHAAHERLVYEALKNALYSKPLSSQLLLIPEIVELSEEDAACLLTHKDSLQKFGLGIEPFGPGAILVRETPAMLGEINAQALIKDLADEAAEYDTTNNLKAMLDYVAATMACHSSVRSGRLLRPEEMNALLRQIEETPHSSTCNHGRPTYIELKLADIERLFGRK